MGMAVVCTIYDMDLSKEDAETLAGVIAQGIEESCLDITDPGIAKRLRGLEHALESGGRVTLEITVHSR